MSADRPPIRRLTVRVIREPAYVPLTPRKREICLDFGIPPREDPRTIVENAKIELSPGSILFVGGPSGSGKSSVLAAMTEELGNAVAVGKGRFPAARPIVDAIAPTKPLAAALEILTACGLGEPRLWVRRFDDLSDGERFRAGLARAIGASLGSAEATPIICDEFTAILHRRAAKAISYNLRKLVTRNRLVLIVATTHDDVIEDLQPDQILQLGGLEPRLTSQPSGKRPISLRRRVVIERGSVRDYRIFGPMHYRHRDGLGFVDKVFLLKEAAGGDPLGILVFAHAPRELALRNRATEGRFIRNTRRLNRELRILRRLVMHPDVRGCGLGHWFVKRTLPQVGVRFIECLAVMGAVNPVFERGGMTCLGRCPLPPGRLALLGRMREWNLDPFALDFHRKIQRFPKVRRLVEKTIEDWVAAMHSTARYEVRGRPAPELSRAFRQLIGAPPLYYLWDRQGAFPRKRSREDEASSPDHDPRSHSHRDNLPTERNQDSTRRHHPDGPGVSGPSRRQRSNRD